MFDKVETVAHLIQIALTPVFLFSGVATLLSVLATRLGRVADRVDMLSDRLEGASAGEAQRFQRRLVRLRRRSAALDLAVIMAALGGMSTLIAAGLLFVGGLRDRAGVTLFVAFGAALLLTIVALAAFLYEMLLASVGIRRDTAAAKNAESLETPETAETPEPQAEPAGE